LDLIYSKRQKAGGTWQKVFYCYAVVLAVQSVPKLYGDSYIRPLAYLSLLQGARPCAPILWYTNLKIAVVSDRTSAKIERSHYLPIATRLTPLHPKPSTSLSELALNL